MRDLDTFEQLSLSDDSDIDFELEDPLGNSDTLPFIHHQNQLNQLKQSSQSIKIKFICSVILSIIVSSILFCIFFVLFPYLTYQCAKPYVEKECLIHHNKFPDYYVISYKDYFITSFDSIYNGLNQTKCYVDESNQNDPIQLSMINILVDQCDSESYLSFMFGLVGFFVCIAVGIISYVILKIKR